MPVPDRIERTLELAHPPEAVWRALTTAGGLGGWFGTSADVDLRPGGKAHVRWDENTSAILWINVVEQPRRFAYTWGIEGLPDSDPRRTYVEFTLEPTGTGTRLTVVESGFAQIPDALLERAYEGNVKGWEQELGELVTYLDAAA
ncbi:MAG: SRPBCC domain-containing protein [Jiangellaceae bacterium]